MSDDAVQSTKMEFCNETLARASKKASLAADLPSASIVPMEAMSSPSLSRMNLRLFEMPAIWRRLPVRSAILSRFRAMMSTSAFPTVPYPAMNKLISL